MPPVHMRGDGRMAKDPKKTLGRLLSYLKHYIVVLALVVLCIFATALAQSNSSTALGRIVDDFILPMVEGGIADYSLLRDFLVKLAVLFLGQVGEVFGNKGISFKLFKQVIFKLQMPNLIGFSLNFARKNFTFFFESL